MKRIVLFLMTNLAVMLVLSATIRILGLDRIITANGLDVTSLLILSVVIGFTGSIISLLISKPMAKMSTGAQVIDPNAPRSQQEAWLVDTVHQLADRAGIGRPEVAIYEGAPNAFATGAFKNDSLVAVSTGLLESMTETEVAAVLGHEVAHIANGDMVTLTLIQGVVNTFVVFFARVVGYFVDRTVFRTERGVGPGYWVTVIVCEIIFGVLASIIVAWFSRQREFRADAGSAHLMGAREPMIHALARLGGLEPGDLPKSFEASGISGRKGISALFSSHPPIQQRIAALQNARIVG
ncbi:protease HtpX [Bordetella genomosp. 1]|uniref:Protease HtpX homolog n=1 Tax=Bordetella genomosp. 1 TaxID=1395607 RepID=A0ABX4F198_9BORD|nr:protease HtpX [Bordetella genomosp. 1]MDQ8030688.1 protease HtpX [Bordetella sp.]OZI65787.1 zinc metalloprotease HtpX [Bordetella genomosp. 1]